MPHRSFEYVGPLYLNQVTTPVYQRAKRIARVKARMNVTSVLHEGKKWQLLKKTIGEVF